jgi:hypothetical protein
MWNGCEALSGRCKIGASGFDFDIVCVWHRQFSWRWG